MLDFSLSFNDVSSNDIGDIIITKSSLNNRPQRKHEVVSVPGRNGNLVFFQDAYENLTRSYEIAAGSGADDCVTEKFYEIAEWLMPVEESVTIDDYINLTYGGYHRLQEGNDDAIMLAYFTGPFSVEHTLTRLGRATISFSCRPERFTPDAFDVITKTTSGETITNETERTAKPFLKVYGSGSGTVVVNGYVITISSIADYLHIDCETQNCYRLLAENRNSVITLTSGFPVLDPGDNTITFTGDITQVDIYPRWWNL